MKTYSIAVVPGDGIGREVVPEGLRVLDAVSARFGFALRYSHFDWDCETYRSTGRMMPEDGLQQLQRHDAIFLGAVGYPGVPDHISLWGLLIPIRRAFDRTSTCARSDCCRGFPAARTSMPGISISGWYGKIPKANTRRSVGASTLAATMSS